MVLQPLSMGMLLWCSESKRFTGGAFHRSAGSDRSIGLCAGTTVDLRVVRIVDSVTTLQSEPYAFTYQVPTAVVDSVSPTTVNDTPTRLFITGTGFTPDSFASLDITNLDLGSRGVGT